MDENPYKSPKSAGWRRSAFGLRTALIAFAVLAVLAAIVLPNIPFPTVRRAEYRRMVPADVENPGNTETPP